MIAQALTSGASIHRGRQTGVVGIVEGFGSR